MLDTRDLVFFAVFGPFLALSVVFILRSSRRANQQTNLLIEGNRLLGELVELTRERR